MNLHLIRHTSLDIAAGICYGQSDVDVSSNFELERATLAAKLSDIRFDAVYASPLQRCIKLAQALNLAEIHIDERLKELHFGDWEMQAWNSIPRDVFDTWANDYANLTPPNGESFSQLHARAKSFTEEVSIHSRGKSIAVVTHGGVIRAILAEVLNMPLKGLFRIVIDHASVTQISFNEAMPRIHFVNR
ncbi:MAG: alpha-ribazole phosphatase [Betaproteobacteria bacterium HGW-Betaproteobacteria-22]|nr:MAG: alpha-ribazole phosphatase [Betaproteobacteria bacterium HGW-Betaproteobacteria-22]